MRKLKSVMLAVCMLVFFSVPVLADTGPKQKVYDQASLFTQEESDSLQEYAEKLTKENDAAFVIVTTDQNDEVSAQEYADSFLLEDYYGQTPEDSNYGKADGMLFLIDMDTRNYVLSTVGSVYDAMGQEEVDSLLDDAFDNIKAGNYYDASYQALTDAADCLQSDQAAGVWLPIVIGLVGAILITVIVLLVLTNASKKSKLATEAGAYLLDDSIHITGKQEVMTGSHTTVTPIPKDNDGGGGGGGSHTSGGGATMGGGSRSF
ncbi:MAG: TPM domain-containing protein [Lachnospiraceae bacterium]|nr:TPM domain-containing protein [Lachnospiraceae bacterium]